MSNTDTNLNDTQKPHTVVLFHGLCSTPLEVTFLAANLRKEGYVVEIPSFAGYAFGSDCSSAEDWEKLAIDYVTRIQEEKPDHKISIGGVSMGAVLAMAVAEHLDHLHGLILLSPTLIIDGWAVPWYRFLIPLGIALGLGNKIKYPEQEPYGVKNPQIRAYIRRQLEKQQTSAAGGASFTLNHLYQGDRLCKRVRNRLGQITASTLIVHAIDDEVATTRNVDLIIEGIESTNKRVIYLGNSYHMITIDNERETVDFEILSFLETSMLDMNNIEHLIEKYGFVSPELQRYLKNVD